MPYLTNEQKTTLNQLLADNELTQVDEYSAANKLNEPTTIPGQAYRQKVPPGEIQRKVYELGKMFQLIQLTHNQNFGDLATTALGFFESPQLPPVDVDADAFGQMLAGLKSAGIITDSDIAAILSLADATTPSTEGKSLFAQAFPGLRVEIGGVGYVERCHAELIVEARGQ